MSDLHDKGLFVFRHDLRLADNPALIEISTRCQYLLCVFVIEDRWFKDNEFQCQSLGVHRQSFLRETLTVLDERLRHNNQRLHIVNGGFQTELQYLIDSFKPNIVCLNEHCGNDENTDATELQKICNAQNIEFIGASEAALLDSSKMPFEIDQMPNTFSPFRRKIEKQPIIRKPLPEPDYLPLKALNFDYQNVYNRLSEGRSVTGDKKLRGGETHAINQLNYYLFDTDLICSYKQTRNELDGWNFSSKLSAWLANGSLSAATVAKAIDDYEQQRTANDSTYWLIFELLWREFFHLQASKHGSRLFLFSGIQSRPPNTQFNAERFNAWCTGNSGFEIVDACMRQLNETGFMSNRGRQLVASCFVHELNLDWRYGAAYFEQQLVDYDVGSNWGNWQYLAGVGSDPRGHRKFNLDKQTNTYDPNRTFIKKWLVG